jgi:SAM-dependent methyltransferase
VVYQHPLAYLAGLEGIALLRAFAEFARVLRPGGHLVISDSRGLLGSIGTPVVKALPGGVFGYLPHHDHLASDYLATALSAAPGRGRLPC